ncbi:hypothetical protein E2562_020689 [Oryza meyeriana var. granulata]|uniref:DNA glycosylase/AP lyase H2TH DNA-binding domain-containing protein n=1 Tax=Oryza meyeriana var. granulata TaxID=110450 RepID=A0A6G1EN03_9ORYZ|nr:hypothetical protein E2562_020689 [Oryza meyeriana var. granulata]
MSCSFISGIGNWIADEVLYQTLAYVPELQKLDGIDARASGKSNKAAREVDNDKEEAKPAKRGRKKSVASHEVQEDEADAKALKRGRKQPAKTSKGSPKKAHNSCEGSSDKDSDEEAVDKVGAERGKRRDLKQPANEVKSLSDKGGSADPAKRPEEETAVKWLK